MARNVLAAFLACSLVFFVSGCAHMADDGSRTRAEGAGTGAAAGVVIGAIVGQIIGGDTAATLIGAGIGSALGGLAGYAYGDHVATQKAQFAQEEDWLDACLAEAQRKNQEILAYNKELSRQISGLEQEIKALQGQQEGAQQEISALTEKKTEVDTLLAEANEQLKSAQAELELQNGVVADAKNSDKGDYAVTLDSEIMALQASIKELEKNTAELASLSASMSV